MAELEDIQIANLLGNAKLLSEVLLRMKATPSVDENSEHIS